MQRKLSFNPMNRIVTYVMKAKGIYLKYLTPLPHKYHREFWLRTVSHVWRHLLIWSRAKIELDPMYFAGTCTKKVKVSS